MPCYYPMRAYRKADGTVKVLGSISSVNGQEVEWTKDGDLIRYFNVPCGKCIGCRLEYSRQWAIRCLKELEMTKGQSWFLTLTYDNDHLPKVRYVEESTGIDVGIGTLKPEDLQLFIKRLRERIRRKYNVEIRFFACGEYGDRFKRPHYHAIVFNLPLEEEDLHFWSYSDKGSSLYTSDFLDNVWDKGILTVQEVSWECCAYVARYVMKKAQGPQGFSYASENGLVDEFTRMSRRPGIGAGFFQAYKDDIYKLDLVNGITPGNLGYAFQKDKGPVLLQSCKYYDKLFDVDSMSHVLLSKIKQYRIERSSMVHAQIMSNTSVSSIEYNTILANQKTSKTGYFSRDFEI